jgi:hypothetical protein
MMYHIPSIFLSQLEPIYILEKTIGRISYRPTLLYIFIELVTDQHCHTYPNTQITLNGIALN